MTARAVEIDMRLILALLTCTGALACAGCASPSRAAPDWVIVPGQRAGAVLTGSTEAQLVRAYGAAAVRQARIEVGEGESVPGTVLFATDSLRRLEILWHDTVTRSRPARLVLRGTQSRWQLPTGISLGTRLRDLERRNGRAFTLAGFGWDYGGVIVDWKGGVLAHELPGVKLYLDPGAGQSGTSAYAEVLGDRDYASSVPAMQALDPAVYQIFVDFESSVEARTAR
jgi:hypothetical protein